MFFIFTLVTITDNLTTNLLASWIIINITNRNVLTNENVLLQARHPFLPQTVTYFSMPSIFLRRLSYNFSSLRSCTQKRFIC